MREQRDVENADPLAVVTDTLSHASRNEVAPTNSEVLDTWIRNLIRTYDETSATTTTLSPASHHHHHTVTSVAEIKNVDPLRKDSPLASDPVA